MAKLVVLNEGLTGQSYELKVERTTVGRVEDNAFHIHQASISSHHCEIWLRGNDVVVKDLNSTNGTCVNGQQVIFFSSRRRHTRYWRDWSSDVCSSDLSSLKRRFHPVCRPRRPAGPRSA